jgi:DNA repair ATPase RecN
VITQPQTPRAHTSTLRVDKTLERGVSTARLGAGQRERVREIAPMLGGDESEKSRDHARELLAVG